MSESNVWETQSATYKLVGVITIGVTHIPIISFGYPESVRLTDPMRNTMITSFEHHVTGKVDIESVDENAERVIWSLFPDISDTASSSSQPMLRFFMDIPKSNLKEDAGSRLFFKAAQNENGFLIAVTMECATYLCFYDLKSWSKDPESGRTIRLRGELSRFASGPAVPILRDIETLRAQVAPQRKIQIADESLGIIHQSLFK